MRSMKSRFAAILGVVAVGLAALAVFAALQARSTLLAERRESVLSHVDVGQDIIDRYLAMESSGKLDRATAQHRAIDELSAMRWDNGNGYFFVIDSELTMLMHPALPELVDTYVGDLKGTGGRSPYSEMVELDKRNGHGFLDYEWSKPGGKDMLPKIGYVNMTPAWDWHLGTGVYVEDVNKAFHGILAQLGAFAALASLVVLGVLLIAVRGLGRSIGGEPYEAMAMAQRIAAGNLRAHGDEMFREGSVLHALAGMRMRLADIVGEVRQGTDVVRVGTGQISQGNDDLSQRTQEQASSLEETASAMEELTATVRQSADNAHAADRLACDACDQARQGSDVVNKAMHAMSEIGDSSRRIGDIVGLIDDMAFQTNLLALNAAVEAARAGEQGRGFAVVAAEVRHLSQRSASAAREIKTLIHDSAQKVESGSQLVSQSGKALQDIFASASKVSDIVAEIAAASQEQSAGIEQINKAVMQMDETTQQNAALVEEAAAASRAMSERADHLAAQVALFQLVEAPSPTSQAGIVQQREGRWRNPHAMGIRDGFASA